MGNIKAGELIIRDLGYYSVDSYKKIEDNNAFSISRMKSQIKIYEKKNNRYVTLELSKLINRIRKSSKHNFDQSVYIGANEKKELRLIAWLLE